VPSCAVQPTAHLVQQLLDADVPVRRQTGNNNEIRLPTGLSERSERALEGIKWLAEVPQLRGVVRRGPGVLHFVLRNLSCLVRHHEIEKFYVNSTMNRLEPAAKPKQVERLVPPYPVVPPFLNRRIDEQHA